MENEHVQIGKYIYIKDKAYNRHEYYDYVEDDKGKLYACHYGHDGDQDWYITCFEDINGSGQWQSINEKYYYRKIGQVPYILDHVINLGDFVGKSLSKEVIGDRVRYGFIDFDEWKFYVLMEE